MFHHRTIFSFFAVTAASANLGARHSRLKTVTSTKIIKVAYRRMPALILE